MRQFKSFVKKEFLQIFRDRRTLLILLAMPLVLVMALGYAIKTELNNARMAVFDASKDARTLRIKEAFRASKWFTIVEEAPTMARIDELFSRGEISMALVFGPDFAATMGKPAGETAIQVIADGTDPNQAAMLTAYAQGVMATATGAGGGIGIHTRMLYNPQQKSSYNFVPGVMGLVLMLICAMMTSVAIVREKETGTMEVLLASPMKPLHIILSKMAPYFTLSVVNIVTVLLLAVFVMGVPIRGSIAWLSVASVLFIVVALALGLLISTLVDRQMSALLVSGIGLMMPTLVFSGLIFPIENMPAALRWISDIIPARWYISAVRKIMIEGTEPESFAKELCIIALMAVVLMAAAMKKFKVRLC